MCASSGREKVGARSQSVPLFDATGREGVVLDGFACPFFLLCEIEASVVQPRDTPSFRHGLSGLFGRHESAQVRRHAATTVAVAVAVAVVQGRLFRGHRRIPACESDLDVLHPVDAHAQAVREIVEQFFETAWAVEPDCQVGKEG